MKTIKTYWLKIKSACAAFSTNYPKCTGVIVFLNMFLFGVLLPWLLTVFVTLSRSTLQLEAKRSSNIKQFPIDLLAAYFVSFLIILGTKVVCQPMMTFFVRRLLHGRTLLSALNMGRMLRNMTVSYTILELVYATIIPLWPIFNKIVLLIRVFILYFIITYYKKLERQADRVFALEGMAPWA